MLLIVYAHPYPRHSHINKALLQSIADLDEVKVHSLYDVYPDFNINVRLEQSMVNEADTIVIQHPMQWYNMPALLKLWFDKVFEYGWAYGHEGTALKGKQLIWVVTTGGEESHFVYGEFPGFASLSQPLQKTALYCGMTWLPPFVLHNTFNFDEAQVAESAQKYRQHLMSSCGLKKATPNESRRYG